MRQRSGPERLGRVAASESRRVDRVVEVRVADQDPPPSPALRGSGSISDSSGRALAPAGATPEEARATHTGRRRCGPLVREAIARDAEPRDLSPLGRSAGRTEAGVGPRHPLSAATPSARRPTRAASRASSLFRKACSRTTRPLLIVNRKANWSPSIGDLIRGPDAGDLRNRDHLVAGVDQLHGVDAIAPRTESSGSPRRSAGWPRCHGESQEEGLEHHVRVIDLHQGIEVATVVGGESRPDRRLPVYSDIAAKICSPWARPPDAQPGP